MRNCVKVARQTLTLFVRVRILLPQPGSVIFGAVSFEVWLSLVERYVRDVEAAGSNPVTSTISVRTRFFAGFFFYTHLRGDWVRTSRCSPVDHGRFCIHLSPRAEVRGTRHGTALPESSHLDHFCKNPVLRRVLFLYSSARRLGENQPVQPRRPRTLLHSPLASRRGPRNAARNRTARIQSPRPFL